MQKMAQGAMFQWLDYDCALVSKNNLQMQTKFVRMSDRSVEESGGKIIATRWAMAAGLRFNGRGMPMSPSEGMGSTKYCGPSVAADDTVTYKYPGTKAVKIYFENNMMFDWGVELRNDRMTFGDNWTKWVRTSTGERALILESFCPFFLDERKKTSSGMNRYWWCVDFLFSIRFLSGSNSPSAMQNGIVTHRS